MKTLTDTLLYEQKKATALPVVSLVARQYGHPQKAGGSEGAASEGLQWGLFNWVKLYETDTITPDFHGVAIAGDGSLNRIRYYLNNIYHQRVASPGTESDFGAFWNAIMNTSSGIPVAIAALGAEVIVFTKALGAQTKYVMSSDYGASWGAETLLSTSGNPASAIAACHKPDGTCALVGSAAGILWIQLRLGGLWISASSMPSAPTVEGLAVYYDGDYNIIALVNTGSNFQLARIVYGDGYRVTAGNWSSTEYLNTGRATVDQDELLQQYIERLPPYSDFEAAAAEYRSFQHGVYRRQGRDPQAIPAKRWYLQRHGIQWRENWTLISAIFAARAIDNLDLDAPFITQPEGAPPILSAYKQGDKWFFRLRHGTDFYDADWSKAYKLQGSCTYGLALACDSSYIWGTRANEVWRSPLPGSGWTTPTAGSGASEDSQEIAQADVIAIEETIRPMKRSELEITLDNSKGTYSSLPSTHINRGSRVEFAFGYRTTEDETAQANKYFIEDWVYDREPNEATVTLYCIDAWGLLEEYVIPGPQEFNLISDTDSVYDIIEKLMECIGGTLDYKSRCTDITTLYPKLEVKGGETGAGLLKRLLDLVPDVIYFNGLDAYIVYPQADDSPTYAYHFPGGV
jgi:hypothetical protein